MPRIQLLTPSVVNQIAAGEVLERPASAVKELLENSIDALATRITVDVVAGGSELIRIVDDGEGIHPDDLLLAVTSHATSKLARAEDLFNVHSFGFRGEALASMAEVSRLRIRTRQADQPHGRELEVQHGVPGTMTECGAPVGTTIEIRDLFGNIPVRRRFLKTTATEFGQIAEQFTRIAIASPRLHLVLRHNDKSVYQLPATDKPLERIAALHGDDLVEQLIPVESTHAGIRLWGYVGHPNLSKSTRKQQSLFVNGRWIQDRTLQHALTEAYRGLLMVGRHPVAFLFLELPTSEVDVNVHPTKAEVRFRDVHQLFRQVLSTIRSKFLSLDLHSPLRMPAAASEAPVISPEVQQKQAEFADWAKQQLAAWTPAAPPVWSSSLDADDETRPAEIEAESAGSDSWQPSPTSSTTPWPVATDVVPPEPHFPVVSPSPAPSVFAEEPRRALQIHDCYLVVESPEGMMVIDQHALHERILYEQFRERVLAGAIESQRLLVPITVELTAKEAALLVEHVEVLDQLGFGIEEFGRETVLINRHPVLLGRVELSQLVRDLAEELDGRATAPTRRDLLDELLHLMSCKAAVKAGQRLTEDEIEALLRQRHLVDDAHHCPHGRPTILTLSRSELDRQFGRLG